MTYEATSEYELLNDEDELRRRINDGETHLDIAEEIDARGTVVADWLMFHDIELPYDHQLSTESPIDALNDIEWLRERITEDDMSTRDIANEVDVRRHSVRRWLTRHGIEVRCDGSDPSHTASASAHDHDYGELSDAAWAQPNQAWRERDQLYRAYWEYYWSAREIADWAKHSPSQSLISEEMERNDIPRRTASEAATVNNLKRENVAPERIRKEVPPPHMRDDESDDDETTDAKGVDWTKLASDD